MRRIKKLLVEAVLLLCLSLTAAAANAEVTARDLQVAGRALSFLESPFSGETRMGIVFDPADNRSRTQAQDIRDMLGSGLQSGNLLLIPVLVPLQEAGNAQVDLFFLTENLADTGLKLHDRNLPCVTVDMARVRDGTCVMGIRSVPKIEIVVNREAAEKTGTRFASVFRMMIREI